MANYTYRKTTSRATRLGYQRAANRQSVGTDSVSELTCGSCGGLECLCRPRFFAGQLLTEEDLNRLDQYMVKKQRLHNRQLHGWGVVCGLELSCDPCDNLVRVSSGYGLSPCGDDIVVCADESVDVCSLIQACLEGERRVQPCDPPYHGNQGCADETEEWLLMIRYQETPSRGIAALRNATAEARCRPCDCGSSGGCDCDDTTQTRSSAKPQPAQCEPTLLCEGYSFEVCRVPPGQEKESQGGAMSQRFAACSQPFFDYLIRFAPELADYEEMEMAQLYDLCCRLKGALLDILSNHTSHNCTLVERLQRMVCPEPDPDQYTPDTYRDAITERLEVVGVVWYYSLIDCLCSVLLPLCESSDDPRLVLGKVTIRKRDCKVLQVCNWITERKFVTSFPNLQYWLSWLPYMRDMRELMEQGCCDLSSWLTKWFEQIGSPEGLHQFGTFNKLGMASFAGAKAYAGQSKAFSNLAFSAFAAGPGRLTPKKLFNGVMGMKDENGEPYLSELERSNLLPTLMLDRINSDLIGRAMPSGLAAVAGLASGFTASATGADSGAVETMRAELTVLKETVELQKQQIDELKKRIG
ncbi:MAG: hypothetical protein P8103_08255 [Candidatus Thiodiazotropha sp.]